MNILLVEDEPELSQLAAESMEHMGHKVLCVTGVQEALKALADEKNDLGLMISDHRLPDGWGVALVLECRVKYPRLKVAVVSGVLTPENVELLEEYNIPYWHKPVIYSKVLRTLLRPPPPPVRKDNTIEPDSKG
jgi:DNA-binding NtrC family response regulator